MSHTDFLLFEVLKRSYSDRQEEKNTYIFFNIKACKHVLAEPKSQEPENEPTSDIQIFHNFKCILIFREHSKGINTKSPRFNDQRIDDLLVSLNPCCHLRVTELKNNWIDLSVDSKAFNGLKAKLKSITHCQTLNRGQFWGIVRCSPC